jgi:hypothetical protein
MAFSLRNIITAGLKTSDNFIWKKYNLCIKSRTIQNNLVIFQNIIIQKTTKEFTEFSLRIIEKFIYLISS